jgi:hypothetical protein
LVINEKINVYFGYYVLVINEKINVYFGYYV